MPDDLSLLPDDTDIPEPQQPLQQPGTFVKELSKEYLSTEQYIATAEQAVKNMGWQLASVLNDTIMCHTRGTGNSLGESVTIAVYNAHAVFTSRSMNEYYPGSGQNEVNYEQYVAAFAAALQQSREVEKRFRLSPAEQYGALLPSKTYLITPLLIYINIAIFICMVVVSRLSPISPSVQGLYAWGGNFRSSVLDGQWWRLFTHMFLHGGIVHLLMNMFALLYVGMTLEPLLGRFRFATAYLLTGICGGLLSITFHAYSVGVGASGAIFGLYGVFLAMLTTNHIQKTIRKTMLRSILFFVVYNLMFGLQGNTDNAAHIGGLLSGLLIGYAWYPGIRAHVRIGKQMLTALYLTIAVIIISVLTIALLQDDLKIYQQKMTKFSDMESMALEVYKMPSDAPKADILYNISDRGIYYWNEDLKLLKEMEQLDLPPAAQVKDKKLVAYCTLRIKAYRLLYEDVDKGTDIHATELKDVQEQIDGIVTDLKKE